MGKLTEEQMEKYDSYKTLYAGLSARCYEGLKRIDS
jgi:hypothetical protein